MATLKEKQDEMARIRADLQRMEADESVTEEDSGDLRDTLLERWEQLDAECKPIIERMERVRGITRTAGDPANREDGADNGHRAPEFMQRLDPFDDLQAVRSGMVRRSDLVSRALSAIENDARRHRLDDDRAEAATQKIQWQPNIARHALLTGSDEYQEAFRAYLEDPLGDGLRMAQRALSLATGSAGFLLPYVLDPTIVLTSNGSTNPYRQLASVKQTTSNAWQGVNSAGVTASLLAEAAAASDASPTIGQIQIFPQKFAAWVFGSFEELGDTNFAEQLPGLLADAKDVVEETQFAIELLGVGYIGSVGFHDEVLGPVIGYWLGEPFWHRGLMTEAAGAALDWYFWASDALLIGCGAFAFNKASLAIQKKLGFTVTGYSTRHCLARGEEVRHIDTELSRNDWAEAARARQAPIPAPRVDGATGRDST